MELLEIFKYFMLVLIFVQLGSIKEALNKINETLKNKDNDN